MCWSILTAHAAASPWPREQYKGFIETRSDYFLSRDTFSRFERVDGSIYTEFGLTPRITIGGKAIYGTSRLSTKTPESLQTSTVTGLSEIEGFTQYTFLRREKDIFSLRAAGSRPASLSVGARPELATDGVDGDFRFLYGRTLLDKRMKLFVTTETGYRLRLGEAADQARIDFSLGFEPTRTWLILTELQSAISIKNNTPQGADFDVVKAQPSVVWRFSQRYALRVGGVIELAARGFTPGSGAFLAFWSTF